MGMGSPSFWPILFVLSVVGFVSFVQAESSPYSSCAYRFAYHYGPSEEEEAKLLANGGDLFKLEPLNSVEANLRNQKVLDQLLSEPFPKMIRRHGNKGLDLRRIESLFWQTMKNPQLEACVTGTYRGSAQYGYCWGRAMFFHIKAIQFGLSKNSVKKVWAVGKLSSGSDKWRYHVTTIVRADNGTWYALDSLLDYPIPIQNWYRKMSEEYDPSGTMRIFVTDGAHYSPGSFEGYKKADLENESYEGLFVDFLDALYQENTGGMGYWSRIKSVQEKKRLIRNVLKISTLGAMAGGGIYSVLWLDQILREK